MVVTDDAAARRVLTVGLVGNVVTQPFAALARRMAPIAQVGIEHLDYGQVVQTLGEPVRHDVLIVHLDHRWFFDVAPNGR